MLNYQFYTDSIAIMCVVAPDLLILYSLIYTHIIHLSVPPKYIINSSFTAVEGMNLIINLGLTGNPFPNSNNFQWTFNGAPFNGSGDIVLGLQSLNLGAASQTEAGNYSVTTSTIAGSATAFFQVIVYCEGNTNYLYPLSQQK